MVTKSAQAVGTGNAELHRLCLLGAISIGSDNCINPKMPRSELQQYDDGTIQTLINPQTPIDTLFKKLLTRDRAQPDEAMVTPRRRC